MARRRIMVEKVRGRHFPYHYKLEELLRTFDPAIGPFRMEMFRRNARDLRKWLEGPQAVRDAPGAGLRIIELPRGWELRLGYLTPPNPFQAGKVIAVFVPPPKEEEAPENPAAKLTIDTQAEPAEEAPALV
jgi:hypothetical protein